MTMLSARTVVTTIALVALSRSTGSRYRVPAPTVTQVYHSAVRVDWEVNPKIRFHEVYSFTLEHRDETTPSWRPVNDDDFLYFYLKTYYVTGLKLGYTYEFRLFVNNGFDGMYSLSDISDKYTMLPMSKNVQDKLYSKPTNIKSKYLGKNKDFPTLTGYVANITWQFTSSDVINGFRVVIRLRDGRNSFNEQVAGFADKTQPFFIFKTRNPLYWFTINVQTFNYKTLGPLSDDFIQCNFGAFGSKCEKACHCASNVSCSSLTGVCFDGTCGRGWKSLNHTYNNCQTQCNFGTFGINCEKTCHCTSHTRCSFVTGVCSDGTCARGWTSLKHTDNNCQIPCNAGFHGENCEEKCGKCNNSQACKSTNGECSACMLNFRPPLCKDCNAGLYGEKCEKTCGNCNNTQACNSKNGECSACMLNFRPPFCKATTTTTRILSTTPSKSTYPKNQPSIQSNPTTKAPEVSSNDPNDATTSTTRIPSITSRKSMYPKSQSSFQSKPTTKAPEISNKDPNDVIIPDDDVTPGYVIAILSLVVVLLLAVGVLVFRQVLKKRKQNDVPKMSLKEDDVLSLATTKRSVMTVKSGNSTRPSCLASSKLTI